MPALTAAACAGTPRIPLYKSPALTAAAFDAIVVAPIADGQALPETVMPVASYIRHTVERVLAIKGYRTTFVERPASIRLETSLFDMEPAALTEAAGAVEGYVLWIAVERVDTDFDEVGADTRVRVAGLLLHAATGEVLWRDRATRESSISGVGFATISPSVRTYEAVQGAVTLLLDTLPDASPAARP